MKQFLSSKQKKLSKVFPVNSIPSLGQGWFDCYLTNDIIMIYKIEGQSVQLFALGTAKDLYKRR